MTCAKPVCERPCSWDCPREREATRRAWYKLRVRGKMLGPLDYYSGRWLELVENKPDGGWPRGADEMPRR